MTHDPSDTHSADASRRHFLAAAASTLGGLVVLPQTALAQSQPDVTATEILIGNTTSLSGPVSALGTIARAQAAYFKMVNAAGGVGGKQIKFIFHDDGFNPAKTAEMARKLIEQDEVAVLFGNLGTGPNSAIVKHVNQLGVPHLFLSVNGDKWTDYKTNPWSMPFAPSGRVECQVAIKHTLQAKPDAKFAILDQNDDFGRDDIAGARDVLGARDDSQVKAISDEVTDTTLDSTLAQLLSSPADALISGMTGKFGTMAIRRANEMNFKGNHDIATGVTSVQGVLIPAGVARATGVLSTVYAKDPSDPGLVDDPAIKAYKAFMAKWYPEGNPDDFYNAYSCMCCR